ncbi:hypothetical protein Fmac_002188 [Flemingia macrophylla]|uniref:Bulb-type lectin domain-containing protein n=1 Tax=Flemingia macrophylla TaxID=520843 RepID=A0ABD1NK01_9FABA
MATLLLLIPTLIYLHHLSLAFANVSLNSSLSTDDKHAWRSPSGEFAFGFRLLNNDTNHKLYMLAIWYDKIPNQTVVWSAKADNTLATAPTGSRLQITSQGLSLKNSTGDSIWTSTLDVIVSQGAMLDTGNFVLLNGNSEYVWQSFQNPTDTLLPNQSLNVDEKVYLNSRLTDTNYSSGRFQLYFQDGNVLLSPLAWPSQLHYNSYNVIDASGAASSFVFDISGDIYVETTNGTRIRPQGSTWGNLTLDPKGYYYRATLDVSGVFTQYSHPRNTSTGSQQGWTIMRYLPGNICSAIYNDYGSGSCGYNSYCSMQSQRPICNCPYGYSMIDPSNEFGGCQPNFTLACGQDVQTPPQELYEMRVARDFNFPLGDYEKIQPFTQDECQQSCLHDCMCAMAILGDKTCWKKRLPLGNGRAEKVNDLHFVFIKTRLSRDLYLAPNREPPPAPDSKKDDREKPILLGSLIGSLVVNSILLATVVFFILFKKKSERVVPGAASLLETNLHCFSYEALKRPPGVLVKN